MFEEDYRRVYEWYDPPSGWQFGFPKSWPQDLEPTPENVKKQLVADGYPQSEVELGARYCRFSFRKVLTYVGWLREVGRIVEEATGCALEELPDWLSKDAYDEGLTPQQGADACLGQLGFALESLQEF